MTHLEQNSDSRMLDARWFSTLREEDLELPVGTWSVGILKRVIAKLIRGSQRIARKINRPPKVGKGLKTRSRGLGMTSRCNPLGKLFLWNFKSTVRFK